MQYLLFTAAPQKLFMYTLMNITLKFPLLASLGACLRFKETKSLTFSHELLYQIDLNYTVTCKLLHNPYITLILRQESQPPN